jgi:hypothetical protein
MASVGLGKWLSAALDDPQVCDEMKKDIRLWFSAGDPIETQAFASENGRLRTINADLLEALQATYKFLATEYYDSEAQALEGEFIERSARPIWNQICAAIAKATGE